MVLGLSDYGRLRLRQRRVRHFSHQQRVIMPLLVIGIAT